MLNLAPLRKREQAIIKKKRKTNFLRLSQCNDF